jgi:hypothetical protein
VRADQGVGIRASGDELGIGLKATSVEHLFHFACNVGTSRHAVTTAARRGMDACGEAMQHELQPNDVLVRDKLAVREWLSVTSCGSLGPGSLLSPLVPGLHAVQRNSHEQRDVGAYCCCALPSVTF